jgi:predicted nuclease of predicted toxin-antitoxin system
MKGFVLDENLPVRLTFKPSLPVCHCSEFTGSPTDTELWDFARARELVIVTKDADFSERIIVRTPPPWVVHVHFGNLRRREFHVLLARLWPHVEAMLKSHKLVRVQGSR